MNQERERHKSDLARGNVMKAVWPALKREKQGKVRNVSCQRKPQLAASKAAKAKEEASPKQSESTDSVTEERILMPLRLTSAVSCWR